MESGDEESVADEDADETEVKEEEDDDEHTDLESNCSGLTDVSGLSDVGEDLMADEAPEGTIDLGLELPPKKKAKVIYHS